MLSLMKKRASDHGWQVLSPVAGYFGFDYFVPKREVHSANEPGESSTRETIDFGEL